MKNAWLGSATSGSPTPHATGDAVDAPDLNHYGDDDRAWGGDVSAEGHSLKNAASVQFVPGTLPASPTATEIASDAPGVLKVWNGSAWTTIGAAGLSVAGDGSIVISPRADIGHARVTANTYPSTGAGLELAYDTSGAGAAYIIAYDRTANASKELHLAGSKIFLATIPTYASDAAAGTAGLTAGGLWKDSSGGLHVKL